jgi:hypothetical protein
MKTLSGKLCNCGCGNETSLVSSNEAKTGLKKGEPRLFIRGHSQKGRLAERCCNWKGGRKRRLDGYVLLYMPDHPRATEKYVLSHIIEAEKALGKLLPEKAVVHHHSSEQLVICQNQAYHNLIHRRQRALMSCGHSHWRKCSYCHQYDEVSNLYLSRDGQHTYHVKCKSNYDKLRKERDTGGLI